mgnify:CR=1 FL=1
MDIKTLREARARIESNLDKAREKYDAESLQYMYYCFGIRDACWVLDDLIEEARTIDSQ